MEQKDKRKIREWIALFVRDEMRHGITKKVAKQRAEQVVHSLEELQLASK